MIKVSFEFDENTKTVSNVKVTECKLVPKISNCDVDLQATKLLLSNNCISKLNAVVGDKISVQYWTVNNQETFPLIGKAECFTDKENGNKLSKTGSVSFRGNQQKTLSNYGQQFKIEEFDKIDGAFKLVKIEDTPDDEDLTEEQEDLKNLESVEVEDDLPF